ncbi:unnamed protein product [Closterium sp. NIES-53]
MYCTEAAAESARDHLSPQVLSELFPQRCVTGTVEAAALGASESAAALGASEYVAALGASESAAALGASESAAALGARASLATAVPSGSLSGLHLPTFSTNLVSNAAIQDVWVDTFIPGGQRVAICTCSRPGRHLATFTRRPGSSLYTLTTASAQVAESSQVAASNQMSTSGQLAASCSCRVLSHQTLLWHHRLGHPSLLRLRSMHSRLLVSGLPRSLPSLPRSHALPCLPCIEGRQRAAPHSSEFPPTTAPLQTLHMDVWGPAPIGGTDQERYFLLVVDDYTRYTTIFPLRRKADVSGVLIPWIRAVSSLLTSLRSSVKTRGIRQSFTLSASPQQNGIAERRIGLIMEVAHTSMIHAVAPRFLWPFAVLYAAHQLNLWPCVSFPETLPTLNWMGQVGDASVFRVWGTLSLVRDTTASKLSPRTLRCVFLGFPTDAPPWQFYHPRSRRVFSSQDVTFDECVCYYRLHPHASYAVPLAPLFLVPVPPLVDPLPPTGSCSLRLSSLPPQPAAVDSGAETVVAEPGGAEAYGEGSRGVATGSAGSGGAETRGADSGGAASPGGGGESSPAGAGATNLGGAGGTAGGTRGATGARGTGAAGAGGAGATGPGGPASARGAGGTTSAGGTGAAGAGGTGAVSAVGAQGAAGAGGAGATTIGGTGGPTGTGGTGPAGAPSHLLALPPAPTEFPRREPETRASTPECREPKTRASVRAHVPRVRRSRAPAVPGTHNMTLRPSSVPLRVVLPSPPGSSLPAGADPPFDLARASSPTATRFLATVVTDSTLSSPTACPLVAELVDFAAAYRLDYRASLVSDPDPACPPSVGGEVALGCDVLEDRQEELEYLTAAAPHLATMLLAPEGDTDALNIPTPRSYREAILGTYVDEVPPPGANIVSGMKIFKVKRPPGSPPAFKARYVARGFSRRQGVDFFHTFSPTPKMTTLQVLLHVAAQRDYELHSLEFSTAFLEGSLHEAVWLRRLPGFTGKTLVALGFAPSTADPSLFLRTDTTLPPFYILVYVLQRFGFQFSSPQPTPLSSGHSISAPPSDESVEPSGPYPELVGCLMYLMTCTRPDLAYPLSLLACYVAPGRHRKVHWDATKRVLRYLCSTSGLGLVLGGRGSVVLTGHSVASWADDKATQRSSQGYTFSLGSGSVSWRSTRSSSMLGSSCEVEIYAGAMAT